jgi:hypothetical protein
MTRQDVAVVAVIALATAGAAVGIDLTDLLFAAGSPQAEIRWPVLKQGAVEITLRCPEDGLAAELEAVNLGSEPTAFHGTLCLMSQTAPNPLSRILDMPVKTWEQAVEISLGAKERKIVSFVPDETTRAKLQPRPGAAAAAAKPLDVTAPAAKSPTFVLAGRGNMPQGTSVWYQLKDDKTSIATKPAALEFAAPQAPAKD